MSGREDAADRAKRNMDYAAANFSIKQGRIILGEGDDLPSKEREPNEHQ